MCFLFEFNGFFYIGYVKFICLNFGIVQDYQGMCNLCFDDMNLVKEDIEYVNFIQEDVCWLGFQWDGDVCYLLNYFDQLYVYVVELIEKGLVYVDFSIQEVMCEMCGILIELGKNSLYCDISVDINIVEFVKMIVGEYVEGYCCLWVKIDMVLLFMCMCDLVIYCIKFVYYY